MNTESKHFHLNLVYTSIVSATLPNSKLSIVLGIICTNLFPGLSESLHWHCIIALLHHAIVTVNAPSRYLFTHFVTEDVACRSIFRYSTCFLFYSFKHLNEFFIFVDFVIYLVLELTTAWRLRIMYWYFISTYSTYQKRF